MHSMTEKKIRFGIAIGEKLEKKVGTQVQRGAYLKVTRSEVIEEMLWIVLEQVKNADVFSEKLRVRIIERRKQSEAIKKSDD